MTKPQTETALAFQRLIVAGQIREAYDRYVAADFRHHNPHFRGDRESLLVGMEENRDRFPHKTIAVKQTLEDGDRVLVHSHVALTADGPHLSVMHLFRFQNERIVELWDLAQPVPDDTPNENGLF